MSSSFEEVLSFWFHELEEKQWWVKDPHLDQHISDRFYNLHKKATQCELYHWRESPKGRLAEIIVLDQFSRNIFREQKAAFGADPLALALSQELILHKLDSELSQKERSFAYMPFMHSESVAIHDQALKLFSQEGLEETLNFEKKHRNIILRFGRYPHRNLILDRKSTDEEIEFLQQPGSSF